MGKRCPPWKTSVVASLWDLLQLEPNWDGCGGEPINCECVLAASRWLSAACMHDAPRPSVVPTSRGGIQLEWHTGGIDLEIDFWGRDYVAVWIGGSNAD